MPMDLDFHPVMFQMVVKKPERQTPMVEPNNVRRLF